MMKKIKEILPYVLGVIIIGFLHFFPIFPNDIENYVDFLNALQQVAVFIVGILLAILGAINIFRDYAFIKKLFQLNVDLQITQMILKLVFITGFYVFFTTTGLLFSETDTSKWSQIYITALILIGFKIVLDLMKVGYLIKQIFDKYIDAEKKRRRVENKK